MTLRQLPPAIRKKLQAEHAATEARQEKAVADLLHKHSTHKLKAGRPLCEGSICESYIHHMRGGQDGTA